MKKIVLMLIASLLAMVLTLSFIVCGAQAFAVNSYTLCRDIDTETSKPLGKTTIFMTTDIAAVLWVNLTDVHERHVAKWEWYNPAMALYGSYSADVPAPSPGEYWVWIVVYGSMSIEGYPPAEYPGNWSVKFYIDDVLMFSASFEIISPDIVKEYSDLVKEHDDLVKKYSDLVKEYSDLKSSFELLLTSFDNLKSGFESLQSGYETLRKEFGSLRSDYETLASDYESTRKDYETLISDYESTRGTLNTMRMWMYIFIATTIIFAVTTVVFAIRKPKAKL